MIRHFILTSHYRAPLDFSNEALRGAESGSYKLRDAARELSQAAAAAPAKPRADAIRAALEQTEKSFAEAMNEDFNTAAAIATVFEFARQTGTWIREGAGREDLTAADLLMRRLTQDALGLKWPETPAAAQSRLNDVMQILVDLRNEARRNKNFQLSDQIRSRLTALGIELRDLPEGTKWTGL